MSDATCQVLDGNSVWMREFVSALARQRPTVCWSPVMRSAGMLERWERRTQLTDPPLELTHFPLQRGYARPIMRRLHWFEASLLRRMRARSADPAASPLVCSTPFYAPVAERWPGPVIYYVTDMTVAYDGLEPEQVKSLDLRMCRVARAVCPNSTRIADYLIRDAGCSSAKITIVPNATRAANLADAPLVEPGPLPDDLAHLPRPIVGVIGNLAANMDWDLLAQAVRRVPGVHWVFVGPTDMAIADRAQAEARAWVMAHATFTGPKPYGALQAYARCFDVAVLPYLKKEPTYSGSSTRFYEHLAACRPMLATRGFAELLTMPPLLELVDTAEAIAVAIKRLAANAFRDGQEAARWQASRSGTWEARVEAMLSALGQTAPEAAPHFARARRQEFVAEARVRLDSERG